MINTLLSFRIRSEDEEVVYQDEDSVDELDNFFDAPGGGNIRPQPLDDMAQPLDLGLGGTIFNKWKKRQGKLLNDVSISAWCLSVMPEVYTDCDERKTGDHLLILRKMVRKLHVAPCPNDKVLDKTIDEIEEIFLDEFDAFRNKTGIFADGAKCGGRWNTAEAREGKSHAWHRKWTLEYTQVLGFVAVRLTSLGLGIGQCERSWKDTSAIKNKQKNRTAAAKVEKKTVLKTTAAITEARLRREAREKIDYKGPNALFGDDDLK